jgi:hypothetical protein
MFDLHIRSVHEKYMSLLLHDFIHVRLGLTLEVPISIMYSAIGD